MDLVSAIVTTFKRDIFIVERAILSIIRQTYEEIEIILVDDNLNDDPLCDELSELSKKYDVQYLKQDGNKGACAARNLGIENARGVYIAFLDDDDEWLPEKIERQVAVFRNNPNAGMVSCCGFWLNDDTGEEKEYYNSKCYKEFFDFDDLIHEDPIGSTSQPLIRTQCFKDVGGFWVEQPARQDYEMWIRISQKYIIASLNEFLFVHHMHTSEQISKNSLKSFHGYNNIYIRYKKSIEKDLLCEIIWLGRILEIYKSIDYRNCSLFFKYTFRWYYLRVLRKCKQYIGNRDYNVSDEK